MAKVTYDVQAALDYDDGVNTALAQIEDGQPMANFEEQDSAAYRQGYKDGWRVHYFGGTPGTD